MVIKNTHIQNINISDENICGGLWIGESGKNFVHKHLAVSAKMLINSSK